MSLFKLREWWSTQQGNGQEEFDQGSLCVANVDNDATGAQKIVTGSFSGVLRIYRPAQAEFQPSDVLLEAQLGEAILDVHAGRFRAGMATCLAILHPGQLVVYNVQAQGRSGAEVAYLELQKLYSHAIPHTAANMVSGPFGGAAAADYILVQAYDGQIYIFENAELVTTTYLPSFLVPGPLAYLPDEDSIVTCSSAFELESYRYASFSSAEPRVQLSMSRTPEKELKKPKTLQPEWSLVLGECAVDIKLSYHASAAGTTTDIVVIGEHTLFVVSSMGVIKAQKKLDYHPAAAITYQLPNETHNLLVATHTSNFVIYSDQRVVWTAKGRTVPVAIRVAKIGPLDAAIVLLDDEGLLMVCYLGTAPPVTVLGLTEGKEVDFEQVHARHRELMAVIRSSTAQGAAALADPSEQLIIRTQVPTIIAGSRASNRLDDFVPSGARSGGAPGVRRPCVVRLYLNFAGKGRIVDVSVVASCTRPMTVAPGHARIAEVIGGASTPCTLQFEFTMDAGATPHDLEARFVVSYALENGQPRCGTHTCSLPLALAVTLVPPVKVAAVKLTVALSRSPPSVVSLFEDVAASSAAEGSQHANANSVISLQYANQQSCTILVSKNNNKFRVQASSFEALVAPLQELLSRLRAFFAQGGDANEPPFAVSIEEALPLDWYFEVIESHFALRLRKTEVLQELETAAAQFRAVQKRLLVRYKDTKPAHLGNLPLLLEETCAKLAGLADEVDAVDKALLAAADKLASGTQLILLCLRCRCPDMTDEGFRVLKSHLSPQVDDSVGSSMGWEELTDKGTTQLLRGPLARNEKERSVVPTPIEPLKQCENLKKHIKIVVERVEACGGRLLAPL